MLHCNSYRRSLSSSLAIGLVLLTIVPSASAQSSSPLTGERLIRSLNPHLSDQDPRQFAMKIRTLRSDEYSFFRGTTDVFYSWCAKHTKDWTVDRNSFVLLHGDVHLGNIGTRRCILDGAPTLTFGLVDLDEAAAGPFQLDLLRGAVSLRITFRETGGELDSDSWRRCVERLMAGYRETLEGHVRAEQLAGLHPAVGRLFAEASKDSIQKHAKKYADLDARRFKPVREKKGVVSDLMEPANTSERAAVVRALHEAQSIDGSPLYRELGLASREAMASAVADVARWTRLGSAGSQGLEKFLVLLDSTVLGKDVPLIVELKRQPVPAVVRSGLLADGESEPLRAQEVAAAHIALWPGRPYLTGWSSIASKGYLVRAKGPWSEELSADDFEGPSGINEAATLMGRVIGLAHRGSLHSAQPTATPSAQSKRENATVDLRIRGIVDHLAIATEDIERLGPLADAYLHANFEALQSSRDAALLSDSAEAFIRQITGNR